MADQPAPSSSNSSHPPVRPDDPTKLRFGAPGAPTPPSNEPPSTTSHSPDQEQTEGPLENPLPLEEQATVISKQPPVSDEKTPGTPNPTELGKLLEGKQLGHFHLEEFVGGGGMGAVFRASDSELGRTVAVKVVSGKHNDEETLRRFKNEAQGAARLDHKNIARVYYVGEDAGWHYIVFEFIEGVNIRDLVFHKGPLPLDEAVNYTLQVTEALEHASKRDVVHRDIKPSNVLIMPNGVVKLVDMGLARLHQVETHTGDLTASGVTLGTFDYISPEQARDPRMADVRSDLYSLGCTFYFMLTGQPPFPEGTVLQKLLSHSSDAPPDPRLFRPDLPDGVVDVLHKLLAKQPIDRFQEPQELIGELLVMADQLGLSVNSSGRIWVAQEAPTLGLLIKTLPWVAAILLLALVSFGVDWFGSRTVRAPISPPRLPEQTRRVAENNVTPSPVVRKTNAAVEPPSERRAASTPPAAERQPSNGGDTLPDESTPTSEIIEAIAAGETLGPSGSEGATLTVASDSAGLSSVRSVEGEIGPPEIATSSDVEAAQEVTTVVVTLNPSPEPAAGSHEVSGLSEAFALAEEMPNVNRIELRFNGPLVEHRLRAVVRRPLMIEAAPDFTPVIAFRPTLSGISPAQRMIEFSGGQVSMVGVHFQMQLPVEPSDAWALFYLDQVTSLDMRSCTMSIQNADGVGAILQHQVAFFEVRGRAPKEGMMKESSEDAPPMRVIQLTQCSARGEATLVRSVNPQNLLLHWSQGLLISSNRLLDAIGPSAEADSVLQVELENVTAVCHQGLTMLDLVNAKQYQPELHMQATNCIVATKSFAPLYEHRGVESVERAEAKFDVSGADNFYPESLVRWRVSTREGETREYPFEARQGDWDDEKRPLKHVMWKASPSVEDPVHQHTKSMYAQDDRLGNPARGAGFNDSLTPEFPLLEATLAD